MKSIAWTASALLLCAGSAAAVTVADAFAKISAQMQSNSFKFSLMPGRKWDKSAASPAFRRNYSSEPHGEIFKAHIGGDKFQHNYTAVYAETLALHDARGQPCRLLELGVFRGESLAVWAEFVSAANVVGVDGNVAPYAGAIKKLLQRGAFKDGLPLVMQGLAADTAVAAKFADRSFDLIVDDAGHFQDQQLDVFKVWSRKVAVSGTYVIEDVRGAEAEVQLVAGLRALAPSAALCILHGVKGGLIVLRWERPLPAQCRTPVQSGTVTVMQWTA